MSIEGYIELRSDTFTRPTEHMWQALVARPDLGDDISRADPTVTQLEKLAAEILGKEDALLLISGTMANQVAVMTLTERGDEVIVCEESHIYNLEVAALATLSQVQARPMRCPDGYYDPEMIRSLIRPKGIQSPKTGLIIVENTHNLNRGIPVTVENMLEIRQVADEYDLPIYLDGARLFNASEVLGVSAARLAEAAGMVQVCLTKGLAAPLGSILAGSSALVERARWMKQRIGGGMRQAGIIAAPGIVALQEMIGRMAEDHRRARLLREHLAQIRSLKVYPTGPMTNIVTIELDEGLDADRLYNGLLARKIRIKPLGNRQFRMITHYQVSDEDIHSVVQAMQELLL